MATRQQRLEAREEALRDRARTLHRDKRETFYRRFNAELRDPDTYAALNYLFIAGLHHFYLKRWTWGALDLGVFTIGVAAILAGQGGWGLLLLAAVTVWELPQLFRAQTLVAEYNIGLQEQLLRELEEEGRSQPIHPGRLAPAETQ